MKLKTQTKKTKELIEILSPYSQLWNEWIVTGSCFLSEQEITVIQNYLNTGSHFSSSEKLDISIVTAVSILNKAKWRLKWYYPKFQRWITECLLEDQGIIVYESELDKFLSSPFESILMPLQLKRKLNVLLPETMDELLTKHSEKDLMKYKSIGTKTMQEFKVYLKENNCIDRLRVN